MIRVKHSDDDPLTQTQIQMLVALLCDPDDMPVELLEQARRRAGRETELGRLIGDAIADAVYGKE